jgi:hypothetical protein
VPELTYFTLSLNFSEDILLPSSALLVLARPYFVPPFPQRLFRCVSISPPSLFLLLFMVWTQCLKSHSYFLLIMIFQIEGGLEEISLSLFFLQAGLMALTIFQLKYKFDISVVDRDHKD